MATDKRRPKSDWSYEGEARCDTIKDFVDILCNQRGDVGKPEGIPPPRPGRTYRVVLRVTEKAIGKKSSKKKGRSKK